jgi:uncharacterized protein
MTGPGFDPHTQKYISLATYRRDGREVRTPVWFVANQSGEIYCFSAAGAGKIKRLRNSARSAIAVCDARGKVQGSWQQCSSVIISDEESERLAYTLLLQKYGWQMRLTNFLSTLSGRIKQRAVIRITLDD